MTGRPQKKEGMELVCCKKERTRYQMECLALERKLDWWEPSIIVLLTHQVKDKGSLGTVLDQSESIYSVHNIVTSVAYWVTATVTILFLATKYSKKQGVILLFIH